MMQPDLQGGGDGQPSPFDFPPDKQGQGMQLPPELAKILGQPQPGQQQGPNGQPMPGFEFPPGQQGQGQGMQIPPDMADIFGEPEQQQAANGQPKGLEFPPGQQDGRVMQLPRDIADIL